MITSIDGRLYLNMLRAGAQRLDANRTAVNDLNVFPIPDGDTGDNMFMTVNAGAAKATESELLGDVATDAARRMLLGARGNSGVILSRIFAGIAKGVEDAAALDTVGFIRAMELGVDEAYGAVSTPVEGTILTVYREGVEKTAQAKPESFEELFDTLLPELTDSLEHTPDKLDVLRDAGVVDSGGAGLVYIAQGMGEALSGGAYEALSSSATPQNVDLDAFTEDSVLRFGYCTEFLLRLQRSKVDIDRFDTDAFTDWLNSVGDSVVCFKEGSIVKVHVHTKTPGDILNHCQQYGEFLTTKIENMTLQHNGSHSMQELKLRNREHQKPFGIVTVASGDGLRDLFTSLGVDVVVDGGQSMNPSAEELVKAFDTCNAETVYVFPNNSNIILTAEQAAELYQGSDIRVVRTKNIGEGYAAISMFDPDAGDPETIVEGLNEVARGVVTGMVSRASRDVSGEVEVVKDDYIGFVGNKIYVDEKTPEAALTALCESLNAGDYDILLILAGGDTDAGQASKMAEGLTASYRRSEVIMLDGGQPIYDYILILE
ncbi:DAK2 domain-containing protein [uncultured Ruminococcus sp.]|uniref:DAK2 domain-containing protein n=1 Tax=uncultured Ruminococcus sp. TaxID=165186 RepID=UPI00292E5874|nr:DAK2 domain-containing protein [uncultured Ruminococcus sp.]